MEDVIEKARSARSKCRTCKEKIEKGDLRFGVAYKSRYDQGDSFSLAWHHLSCAAKGVPDKLGPALEKYDGELSNRAELEEAMATAREKKVKAKRDYPFAERAPTGRSKCIGCSELIEKGTFRFVVEVEVDAGSFVAKAAKFVHARCVDGFLDPIDWDTIAANSRLEEADLAALRGECG